ncbi:phosphotransferase enzyme family protein [Streptomyces sp. NPDC055815]
MIADIDAAKRVAEQALAHYGSARNASITFVKYRENYVFRVDEADGSYALRLHRSGYRTDAEILEELDLVTALAAAGVSVPQVRLTRSGELICRVTDEHGDVHQADMLKWVDDASPIGDVGEAFTGAATVDPAVFHALGALIANVHEAASKLQTQSSSVRPAWDAEGIVGSRAVWGDPRRAFADGSDGLDIVDEAIFLLTGALQTYATGTSCYGPIHADFTPENVLVRDGLMTVIDFDDSGEGFYLFDLATAAFFYLPHPRAEEIIAELFAGYASVRPLEDQDLVMWRPMLLARGLTYLGWAADRIGDETSDFILQQIRPRVVDLAAEFVASSAVR